MSIWSKRGTDTKEALTQNFNITKHIKIHLDQMLYFRLSSKQQQNLLYFHLSSKQQTNQLVIFSPKFKTLKTKVTFSNKTNKKQE